MEPDQQSHERAAKAGAILTRRGLFELAGLAMASAALPSRAAFVQLSFAQDQPLPFTAVSPFMEKLSSYMSEAAARALPEEVVEKAKHHVLDTFAAMISGSELRPGRAALQFARAYGGKEIA